MDLNDEVMLSKSKKEENKVMSEAEQEAADEEYF